MGIFARGCFVTLIALLLNIAQLHAQAAQPGANPGSVSLDVIRSQATQLTPTATTFLAKTIQFDTVEDFGTTLQPQTRALLQFVFAQARELGFTARLAAGGLVGVLDYGTGPETVGVLAHLDVVPAPTGPNDTWTYPPFAGTVADGFIWGRGAQDDKGALTAALYGAKILIDNHMPFRRRLRIILGTKEEKSFEDLTRYFKKERQPDFGIVPDGVYLIAGEKGIADVRVAFPGTTPAEPGRDTVVAWGGGTVINTVPEFSYVVLASKDVAGARQDLAAAIQSTTAELASGSSSRIAGLTAPYEAHLQQFDYADFINTYQLSGLPQGDLVLASNGVAVHGSAPWTGRNAMIEVALTASTLKSLTPSAYSSAFQFITTKLGLDSSGGGFGIPFTPPAGLGPPPPGLTPPQYYGTSANLGLISEDRNAGTLTLGIDFRTGLGNTNQQILQRLQASAEPFGGNISYVPGVGSHYEAIYHAGESPLMQTAVAVYRQLYPDRPAAIPYLYFSPGTTYLKLVENFVNFGPVDLYPDPTIDRFHVDDERIALDSVTENIALFANMLQTMILSPRPLTHSP